MEARNFDSLKLQDLHVLFEDYRTLHPFAGRPHSLYEPMNYIMELGGKRARPLLVLSAAHAAGSKVENALPQALAMEIFHNFTLLHDDIMDNAHTRRGKSTVHKHFGMPEAILSGDNMLVKAFELMLPSHPHALKLFARTASQVCEGQQLDMDLAARDHVSEEEYLEMIQLKTAVLLGACAATGAMIAGLSTALVDLFYDFALNLGMAFQLQDDHLDTFGDPALTGKKRGGDIEEGKKTWLYIRALHMDPAIKLIYGLKTWQDRIDAATSVFIQHGLDKALAEKVDEYFSASDAALDKLQSEGLNVEILRDLASWLRSREK